MINQVELKNFGPIEQLDWQGLGKINLIIGNNDCGKSFFLKALYSVVRTLEEYKRGDNPDGASDILTSKLYWTFQAEKIEDLVNKKNELPLSLKIIFDDKPFAYSFDKDVTKTINALENNVTPLSDNSVFLPAKEVLSLHNLILKSREQDKLLGFDDTYLDLVKALLPRNMSGYYQDLIRDLQQKQNTLSLIEKSLSQQKSNNSSKIEEVRKSVATLRDAGELLENLMLQDEVESSQSENELKNTTFKKSLKQLEDIIGGKTEYDDKKNRWYFKKGDQRFSIGVTAEGIKKIGVFDTLLRNGYLSENSIVFIDEPESNLHPEMISKLLDIISILANQGIQFFIASHSYFVIKKLFLVAQEQQLSIPVLSKEGDSWQQSDLLEEMPDNPIIDESIRLYKQEIGL